LPLPSLEEKEKGIIHELQGSHPGIIISNNQQNSFSPLLTVIPLTSQLDKVYPFEVLTEINNQKGKVLTDQITTIDKKRVGKKLATVNEKIMEKIEKALHLTLDLKS
jgi:mRNA interferase MazF